MSFLNWLKGNPEKPEEEQLSLLQGDNATKIASRKRVGGAIVNRDFRKAVQNKRGDSQAQVDGYQLLMNHYSE